MGEWDNRVPPPPPTTRRVVPPPPPIVKRSIPPPPPKVNVGAPPPPPPSPPKQVVHTPTIIKKVDDRGALEKWLDQKDGRNPTVITIFDGGPHMAGFGDKDLPF